MGLLIAAAITTAIVLGGFAVLLFRAPDWRPLALAFVVALPLQPLMFYVVRLPIDGMIRTNFGMAGWVLLLSMFYAPLTEEPAKWLPAAVPAVGRAIMLTPVAVALAVGAGFGIGEIWFLAYALVTAPNYPDVPFWGFQPFIIERLEVCFLHGAFVSLPFVALAHRRPLILGGIGGMVLHFGLNFPIYLMQIGAFGLGREVWVNVLQLWILGMVVAGALMCWRLAALPPAAPAQA
jgi:hypothetical protein